VTADLDALLTIAERTLAEVEVRHALIGGCARNLYAPPRGTRDVDLAVIADRIAYDRIAALLRGAGFVRVTVVTADPHGDVPDVALFSDDSGGRIDLLFAHTDFEQGAIERATPVRFESLAIVVPVVSLEDLIVYKLLAARPRDLVDVEEIVRAQSAVGRVVDWKQVEEECAHWDALSILTQVRGRLGG
jgi:hypothetical protein